jgi:hypothetical protein
MLKCFVRRVVTKTITIRYLNKWIMIQRYGYRILYLFLTRRDVAMPRLYMDGINETGTAHYSIDIKPKI